MELNKVHNADCLNLMKHLPDKSINAVITDPPYLYLNHRLDKPFDEDAVFKEWTRVLKDDGFIVIFGRGESFYRWNYKLNELGFQFKEEIIWHKNMVSNVFGKVARNHETVSILTKIGNLNEVKIPYVEMRKTETEGISKTITDLKRLASGTKNKEIFDAVQQYLKDGTYESTTDNTQSISSASKKIPNRTMVLAKSFNEGFRMRSVAQVDMNNKKSHPTQKPVELLEKLIQLTTKEGDVILDPFLGSGSTAIAGKNLDRNYIGYEIDKEYYDIATKRIEEHEQQLKTI